MISEILFGLLLILNPIPLDDVNIINFYNIELEYVSQVDDLEITFNHLNDTINRSDRIDYWTCYDYSVDFKKNNNEWGVVTTSYFEDFVNPDINDVDSHMVNYYLYDNDTMVVYDSIQDNMYISYGWKNDWHRYYHFWVDNSTPVRRYWSLFDNREVVI